MGKGNMLGLDISSAALRMALCRDGTLVGGAGADMPGGLVRNGRIISPEGLARLIRDTMDAAKLRARRAAVVAPHESCVLRTLSLPPMRGRLLRKSLPYEFSGYLDGGFGEYVFDYALFPEDGAGEGGMELMAAAIPEAVLDQLRELLRRAGLLLTSVAPAESAFQALASRAGTPAPGQELCFLNLDFSLARIFIFRGERHMATHVLDMDLHALEEAIAEEFCVDGGTARGYLLNNYKDCQRRQSSVEIYCGIATELARTLQYYRFRHPDSALREVWVCGVGASMVPLWETLAESLGPGLRRAEELIPGGETVEGCCRYALAAGVAMDGR